MTRHFAVSGCLVRPIPAPLSIRHSDHAFRWVIDAHQSYASFLGLTKVVCPRLGSSGRSSGFVWLWRTSQALYGALSVAAARPTRSCAGHISVVARWEIIACVARNLRAPEIFFIIAVQSHPPSDQPQTQQLLARSPCLLGIPLWFCALICSVAAI